jgi:DNA-binding transcriptional MocR family regulator
MDPMSDHPPAPSTPRSRVAHRIGSIAESATLAVDAKAKALKAAGRPVIGFGAGEPDFPTPGYIVDAAVAACPAPANHRYTPAAGLPELRSAVAAKTLRDSGLEIAPEQVLITNGGKQAVYQAFATLVDPGDEVLLPAPYWTTYPEAIRLAGGVPVEVFAGEDQDYLVTVEALEAARTERTKALLFCSPRTRPVRCTPRRPSRRSGVGTSSTASGSSPTRSTSTSSTTASGPSRCRWRCQSSPTPASSSTASPRPTP